MSPNLKAFSDMTAWSEIGPELLAKTDNGYNVIVGSTAAHPITFSDYSHHPLVYNIRMNSDAAGRYQFMGRYWPAYKTELSLPDFGPASQDRWFLKLVNECHATDDIAVGNITSAIRKCSSRWASFPGNNYGQRANKVDDLISVYKSAGGTIA